MNVWIIINVLSLIFDKTYFFQFRAKTSYSIDINICCNNKYIVNTSITQFSGIVIDTTLSWTKNVQEMMDKLSTLSKAYCAIRAVKSFITQEALRMVHFSYYYVLQYNFWGELI